MYEQTQRAPRYDHCEDLVDYEILCLFRASILTVFVADVRYTLVPHPLVTRTHALLSVS